MADQDVEMRDAIARVLGLFVWINDADAPTPQELADVVLALFEQVGWVRPTTNGSGRQVLAADDEWFVNCDSLSWRPVIALRASPDPAHPEQEPQP